MLMKLKGDCISILCFSKDFFDSESITTHPGP
jgi:hypothetical protein